MQIHSDAQACPAHSSAISLQLYSCSKRRRSISNKFGSSSFGDPGPGGAKAWTTLTNHFGSQIRIASRGSFGVCSASVDCHRALLDRFCRPACSSWVPSTVVESV